MKQEKRWHLRLLVVLGIMCLGSQKSYAQDACEDLNDKVIQLIEDNNPCPDSVDGLNKFDIKLERYRKKILNSANKDVQKFLKKFSISVDKAYIKEALQEYAQGCEDGLSGDDSGDDSSGGDSSGDDPLSGGGDHGI